MADGDRDGWTGARADELARRLSELDDLEPYLSLAREIRQEVARVAADDTPDARSLTELIERFPREAREQVARSVFDRLPVESQWSVLERVFDDAELRDYLAARHEARVAWVARSGRQHLVAARARADRRLDTTEVAPGDQLTLGLFRAGDVGPALRRGHLATTCARELVLRAEGPGRFRVIEDRFNPRRGYFVDRSYDEATWRAERLDAHGSVRVGSLAPAAGGPRFEPVVYPGARLDIDADSGPRQGQLHVGFVMLADEDVFAG